MWDPALKEAATCPPRTYCSISAELLVEISLNPASSCLLIACRISSCGLASKPAIGFDAKPQELILQAINKQEDAGFKLISTKSSAEMLQYVLGGQVAASFNAGSHIP